MIDEMLEPTICDACNEPVDMYICDECSMVYCGCGLECTCEMNREERDGELC